MKREKRSTGSTTPISLFALGNVFIKKKMRRKLTKGVLLLHDNVPAHRALVAENSARNCGFEILEHPPYSPDLAPSDFYLFPGVKKEVFASNGKVMDAVDEFFEGKEEQYFKSGIYKLRDRWSLSVWRKMETTSKSREISRIAPI